MFLEGFFIILWKADIPIRSYNFCLYEKLNVLLVSSGMKTHLQELLDFFDYLKRQKKPHLFCQASELQERLLKSFQRM